MNTKMVVKVMNFHSLLRVDASKQKAEQYMALEQHITDMMSYIMYNRNLILDKRLLKPKPDAPVLNIYIGSDYGFCGSVNSQVNSVLAKEESSRKVVIGKKLRHDHPETVLELSREDFDKKYSMIENVVYDAVNNLKYSEINIVYNHYYNISHIELVRKTIFPFDIKKDRFEGDDDDFIIEADPTYLITKLARAYINYEIKIAAVNCFASENILRQNTTVESLKKIDEREEQAVLNARKQKNQREFKKVIESYNRKKGVSQR